MQISFRRFTTTWHLPFARMLLRTIKLGDTYFLQALADDSQELSDLRDNVIAAGSQAHTG